MSELQGMVVVVNGGTHGLGEATVRSAAAKGARGLVIVGRSAEKGAALAAELTAAGTESIYVQADMADPAAPSAVIAAADARFGDRKSTRLNSSH